MNKGRNDEIETLLYIISYYKTSFYDEHLEKQQPNQTTEEKIILLDKIIQTGTLFNMN